MSNIQVRKRNQTLFFAASGAFLCLTMACWIIPYRLYSGGGYYSFGYICDEYPYAVHLQPLCAGATINSPENGIADPSVISVYYLEDTCRNLLTVTDVNVVSFFWIWRVLFPPILGITSFILARCCMSRRRPWSRQLQLAAGAAGMAWMYCAYPLLMPPPLRNYLERIPTNIEFILSMLFACAYIRFLIKPEQWRMSLLAVAWLALAYLRPYAAMPWGAAAGLGTVWLLYSKRLSPKIFFVSVAFTAIAFSPAMIALWLNSHSVVAQQVFARYFEAQPYRIHPRWYIQLLLAAGLWLGAFQMKGPGRLFGISCAIIMLLLPFTCALFPIGEQLMLHSDRLSFFYFPACLGVVMSMLGVRVEGWRGTGGALESQRWGRRLSLAAYCSSALLCFQNTRSDLDEYRPGNYSAIVEDLHLIPSYEWVRDHTPPDALFLVDDGFDWQHITKDEISKGIITTFWDKTELFQVVARRRRIASELMFKNPLSTNDLQYLMGVQRGTLGYPFLSEKGYDNALHHFQPDYIFWRRNLPIPRGFGVKLQPFSKIVHRDEFCEIWEMHFPASFREKGH